MNDVNDWWDIGAFFISSIPGILAGFLAWRIKVQTAEIGEQVTNDHTTNLRDDIDELRVSMVDIDSRTTRIGDELRIDREQQRAMARDFYAVAAAARRIVEKYHPGEEI